MPLGREIMSLQRVCLLDTGCLSNRLFHKPKFSTQRWNVCSTFLSRQLARLDLPAMKAGALTLPTADKNYQPT